MTFQLLFIAGSFKITENSLCFLGRTINKDCLLKFLGFYFVLTQNNTHNLDRASYWHRPSMLLTGQMHPYL